MTDMENVMHRLSDHAKSLEEISASSGNADRALMAQSLALMSEALLKVGRDVRNLRNTVAGRG